MTTWITSEVVDAFKRGQAECNDWIDDPIHAGLEAISEDVEDYFWRLYRG